MLTGLTKKVEAGLEAELSEHLGYGKHAPEARNGGNSRNGIRSKTVLTEVGPVELNVPRDRDGTFEPQLIKKRQRRLSGVDEMVISLTAKGLTTREVSAHLAEVYGTSVSRETISKITDRIVAEMDDWLNRPLESVFAVVFIDAIVVKVRDGQVTNRPAYCAIGVAAEDTTEQAAKQRLNDFDEIWGERYPAIRRLWDNAWTEFVPFLDYSPEIRRVIYSTNAIRVAARPHMTGHPTPGLPQRAGRPQCCTWRCDPSIPPDVVEDDG